MGKTRVIASTGAQRLSFHERCFKLPRSHRRVDPPSRSDKDTLTRALQWTERKRGLVILQLLPKMNKDPSFNNTGLHHRSRCAARCRRYGSVEREKGQKFKGQKQGVYIEYAALDNSGDDSREKTRSRANNRPALEWQRRGWRAVTKWDTKWRLISTAP